MPAISRDALRRRLRKVSRRLRETEAALDVVSDPVLLFVPPRLRLVLVNQAACASLSYCRQELLGLTLADVAPEVAGGPLGSAIQRLLAQQLHCASLVTVCRRKTGAEFLVEATVRGPEDPARAAMAMLARPVSNAPQSANQVSSGACRDALTGLATRGWLEGCLEHALHGARRANHDFAVLFVDVDDFKRINDTRGHLAGDQVLRDVARHLAASVRPTDLVARYGGDEFVILMSGVRNPREVVRVAQRISRGIKVGAGGGYSAAGEQVEVTISIGVAFGAGDSRSADDWIARADRAMYRAKAMGRNGRWVLDTVAPVGR